MKKAVPDRLQFNDCKHLHVFRGYLPGVFDLSESFDKPVHDILLVSAKTDGLTTALKQNRFFSHLFLKSCLIMLDHNSQTAEVWSAHRLLGVYSLNEVKSAVEPNLFYLDVILCDQPIRLFVASSGVQVSVNWSIISNLLQSRTSPNYGILVGTTALFEINREKQTMHSIDASPIALWCQQQGVSHFVPCGGPIDVQICLKNLFDQEVSWHPWSKLAEGELERPDWWSLLTFLNSQRVDDWFKQHEGKVLLDALNPEVALTLVIMRRVLGASHRIEFELDVNSPPQWKKLIEHLGWNAKLSKNLREASKIPELMLPSRDLVLEIITREASNSGLFPRSLLTSKSSSLG